MIGLVLLAGCATSSPELDLEPLVAPVVPRVTPPPLCDFRDNALAHLAQKYGEQPVAGGLSSTGGWVEVITTRDGSTWTIIVTRPDGWACMVADGENWRRLPRETLGESP